VQLEPDPSTGIGVAWTPGEACDTASVHMPPSHGGTKRTEALAPRLRGVYGTACRQRVPSSGVLQAGVTASHAATCVTADAGCGGGSMPTLVRGGWIGEEGHGLDDRADHPLAHSEERLIYPLVF
jgi:hypothetical protein